MEGRLERLFSDVAWCKFLKTWENDGFTFYSNVVHTGREKYADFTFVITVQQPGKKKFGNHAEVTSEFLLDTNALSLYRLHQANLLLHKYKEALKYKVDEIQSN